MTEYVAPIMRVADANAAVTWYEWLGFVKEWEHRFEPGLPLYVGIARGGIRMHLSERHHSRVGDRAGQGPDLGRHPGPRAGGRRASRRGD